MLKSLYQSTPKPHTFTSLPLHSGIFRINRRFVIGLVSSIITAVIGYLIKIVILYTLEYDILANLDNWSASLGYFCSLGGIRFVISEYLNQKTFLLSTGGSGGSLPAPGNINPPTGGSGASLSTPGNINPPTGGSGGSFPAPHPGLPNITLLDGFGGNGRGYVGHFNDSGTIKLFMPINQNALHGPNGSRYLGDWLTEFRDTFYDIKDTSTRSPFRGASPKVSHIGAIDHQDQERIKELIVAVKPSIRPSSILLNQDIINLLRQR